MRASIYVSCTVALVLNRWTKQKNISSAPNPKKDYYRITFKRVNECIFISPPDLSREQCNDPSRCQHGWRNQLGVLHDAFRRRMHKIIQPRHYRHRKRIVLQRHHRLYRENIQKRRYCWTLQRMGASTDTNLAPHCFVFSVLGLFSWFVLQMENIKDRNKLLNFSVERRHGKNTCKKAKSLNFVFRYINLKIFLIARITWFIRNLKLLRQLFRLLLLHN